MFKIENDEKQKASYIFSPFNADFNEFVKIKCGGKWDKQKNAWCVANEFVLDIRSKMKDIYGRDDTFCEKLVSLKIVFSRKIIDQEISIFGRTILYRAGAAYGEIKKGYGVIIAPNTYRLQKNEIEIEAGTTVIVRDFPLPKLADVQSLDANIEVQIVHDEYDLQMLKSEKKYLVDRLNEVEKMLQKMEDEK